MPTRPPKVCGQPGCTAKATTRGYCDKHKKPAHGWAPDRFRGSRQQRGYGREWEKQREQTLERDSYLCQPCKRAGRVTNAKEVDHIIPKEQGGTDAPDNLQSICIPCHQDKTARERNQAHRPGVGGV